MFPDLDVDNQLRMRRLLQQLPTISPDQISQDQTAAPTAPVQGPTVSPNYTPTMQPSQPGDYTPVPDNMKMPQPQANPYQAQLDEIQRSVSDLSRAGQDVTQLKAGQPTLAQHPVSKLRAALMMPLQILAGAGGVDTSKEYASLIRPGYKQAVSDYQAKLDAAENKYATMKELIKDRLDTLKEEGVISKDQAEEAYQKAETAYKVQELGIRAKESADKAQELEVRKAEIPPVGQAIQLGRAQAAKEGREYTAKDLNKDVEDTSEALEQARRKTEKIKWDAEQAQKIAEKKRTESETNVNADIQKVNTDVIANLKPLQGAKESLSNLRAMFDTGDTEGFSRLMTVIMADNALSSATRGSVRQQLGIINDLIKSPGLWEYIKGKIQGIVHPGKGDISDAMIRQVHNALDTVDKTVDNETQYQNQKLADLTMLDPTDDNARKKLADIETRMPPSIQPTTKTPNKLSSDDIKKIEDQVNAIDAAIKKKLAQQKK